MAHDELKSVFPFEPYHQQELLMSKVRESRARSSHNARALASVTLFCSALPNTLRRPRRRVRESDRDGERGIARAATRPSRVSLTRQFACSSRRESHSA